MMKMDLGDIIRDPQKSIDKINSCDTSLASKKAMVAAVCALIKHDETLASTYAHVAPKWKNAMKSVNKIERDRVSTMEPSKREMDNWVSWQHVQTRERQLNSLEYGSDRHLILALYTLMEPVRCDYGNVEIYIGDKPDRDELNKKGVNYMRISKKSGKSYLVLNTYKTCRRYGCFSRYMPDDLVAIIVKNLEQNPRKHLIVSTSGRPYEKRNSYTRYVNETLFDIFGKRVTVSLLRHAYISSLDFNKLTPKDLGRISKNMQHSVGMQQMYRRRVDAPETAPVAYTTPPTTARQTFDPRSRTVIL